MPDFQKKHYEAIAEIFRDYKPSERELMMSGAIENFRISLVEEFVRLFSRDNGNFDPQIFRMKSLVD